METIRDQEKILMYMLDVLQLGLSRGISIDSHHNAVRIEEGYGLGLDLDISRNIMIPEISVEFITGGDYFMASRKLTTLKNSPRKVGGSVFIQGIKDLWSLDHLTAQCDRLLIYNCEKLHDMSALAGVFVTGHLDISKCPNAVYSGLPMGNYTAELPDGEQLSSAHARNIIKRVEAHPHDWPKIAADPSNTWLEQGVAKYMLSL